MNKSALFPNASSPAYGYKIGYNIVDTLKNIVNCLIKFNSNETISLHGNFITQNTINVVNGWNIIGPFDETVDINSITTQPPNPIISPFYGFGGVYYVATTLDSGKWYWIKANANGTLHLNINLGTQKDH